MPPLRIVHQRDLSAADSRILFERRQSLDAIIPAVRTIMDAVRDEGDDALRRYTERFDGAALASLAVSPEEFARAREIVDPAVRDALQEEIRAVRAFHETHISISQPVQTYPGVSVWREWRPIERVGLYIPGGRGPYPSSVVMLGVPAAIAGCPTVVICTPPGPDSTVPAATLVAAEMVGVTHVFKLGGAQAIAAMAHGTESVPVVDKLFGAGNSYVTAAKLLAFPETSLDAPAGPSELLIVADETASAASVAADLLSDVEHGPDSPAVLVTTSSDLAEAVVRELDRQLVDLPRREMATTALDSWGLIVLVDSEEEACALANRYAPEHLELITANPRATLTHITHAGSIFLGPYAPNAAGDYATGTNHVLPTARYARTFGPVSVESFGRLVQCQEATAGGLQALARTATTLARQEGLEAHARAIEIRLTPPDRATE
jgi:histidinol dehydrogenase